MTGIIGMQVKQVRPKRINHRSGAKLTSYILVPPPSTECCLIKRKQDAKRLRIIHDRCNALDTIPVLNQVSGLPQPIKHDLPAIS